MAIHENVISKQRQRAGTDWCIKDPKKITAKLREAWERLSRHLKKVREEREKFLAESIDPAKTGEERSIAIQQIIRREKSRWQYQRIRKTLQRLKAGELAGVDVPIFGQDGSILGWESLIKKEELH